MKVVILLVSGKKQSGKSTFSNTLGVHLHTITSTMNRSVSVLSLADALKDIAKSLFSLSLSQLYDNDGKEIPDPRYPILDLDIAKQLIRVSEEYGKGEENKLYVERKYQIELKQESEEPMVQYMGTGPYGYLTPRLILQKLGTDIARRIYPDIWVQNWWERVAHTIESMKGRGVTSLVVVCPDARFPNEIALPKKWAPILAVKESCAIHCISIRIIREGYVTNDNHLSETALDEYEFDHTIIGKEYEIYKQQVRDFADKYIVPIIK